MTTEFIRLYHCIFALSLYSWLYPLIGNAQSNAASFPYRVSINHITLEQGLPNRSVTTVGQDKEGLIWIGTLDNAYLFDGKRFTPLPHVANPPKQKSYNPAIEMIRTDRVGNLWLASSVVSGYRNQYVLKPKQARPQQAEQVLGVANPFVSDPIHDYIPSSANSFHYVRTRSGRIWWHERQGSFRALFQHNGLTGANSFKYKAIETDQQTLLLTVPVPNPTLPDDQQTDELIELDSTGRTLRRQTLPMSAKPVWKDVAGNIYLHRLILKAPSGAQTLNPLGAFLYRLQPDGKLVPMPIALKGNPFVDPAHYAFSDLKCYYDAKHSLFWVCGPHVLFAWHSQKGVVFDLSETDFPVASVQIFHQILVDRTGDIWVSTTNGVLLLTLELNRFQRYLHVGDSHSSANWQPIRGMLSVNNQLWVNSRESQLVDRKTGKSQFILQGEATNRDLTTNLCPIAWGDDGMIWTGATGLLRIDPKTFTSTLFSVQLDNPIVSAWADGQHHLWLGNFHGISVVDTKNRQKLAFTRYNQFPELAQSRVNGFFADKQAARLSNERSSPIWVASSSGLYLLDPLRGIIAHYGTHNHTLPFDHITAVHADPDEAGVYWLATLGGGLIRWNRTTGNFQAFTQKQGLSNNTLYAIYEDNHHRLWLPSNYGLMSFDRKSYQVKIYHTRDGIADEEFNLIAHYRAPDGQLFLGGLNGVTAFYPDQIRAEKPVMAPLLVADFQKLDTETGKFISYFADFQAENQLHLSASDRLFSLSFALLDYRYIKRSRLWYRIQGWQEKWVVQDQMDLRINGLPAGDYVIDVRAQTDNGDWVSSVLSVPITVDKPVYLRTWFLLLTLLLLTLAILAIFRWRNRQLVQDKIRLEAEVARRTLQIEQDKAIIEQDKRTIQAQANDLQANATLKSRFFANVTHEFRTPLTLLLGPLQQLLKRITDSDAHQLLTTMERNTQQLLMLVNDLLDLSRLDASTLSISEKPADLVHLVNQVVLGFVNSARQEGITLQVSGVDQPLSMPFDKSKVETVLRNLLANGMRYTPTGGVIQVSVSQKGDYANIEVSDTGIGIHADDLPHIFDRYFQSNQPDKPLRGGTGIGLALCHEYCTLWGGALTVVSQLGKGSRFTFSYPMRMVEQARLPIEPEAIPDERLIAIEPEVVFSNNQTLGLPNGKRILIVEDNRDMMHYLQLILSPLYQVQTATNGREALTQLEDLPPAALPQLIISDIMMPEVDGMALIQILRKHPLFCSIPIVMLTARVDLESRLQALQFGIADYMTKPFHEAELIARIGNLLIRAEEQTNWQQQVDENKDELKEPLADDSWIQLVQEKIQQNISNTDLTVNMLAELMHMSERQIYRRCKAVTGLSPNQFIHEIRLQIAHDLLERNPNTLVKTIAVEVGYKKLSYFIQLYRERFGISPGEQLNRLKEAEVS